MAGLFDHLQESFAFELLIFLFPLSFEVIPSSPNS
jgi:hypothetical protein